MTYVCHCTKLPLMHQQAQTVSDSAWYVCVCVCVWMHMYIILYICVCVCVYTYDLRLSLHEAPTNASARTNRVWFRMVASTKPLSRASAEHTSSWVRVCMCLYVYVCICAHLPSHCLVPLRNIRVCECVYVCVHMYMYDLPSRCLVPLHDIGVRKCMYVCVYMYMYVCVHIYIVVSYLCIKYALVNACMYVSMCIHKRDHSPKNTVYCMRASPTCTHIKAHVQNYIYIYIYTHTHT
jgi:hypothetical protein